LNAYRRASNRVEETTRAFGVKQLKKPANPEKVIIYDYVGEMVATWVKNRYKEYSSSTVTKQKASNPSSDTPTVSKQKSSNTPSDTFIQLRNKLLEDIRTLIRASHIVQGRLNLQAYKLSQASTDAFNKEEKEEEKSVIIHQTNTA
jgi:hypothetical protein